MPEVLRTDRLVELLPQCLATFEAAQPFPHFVFDGAFDQESLVAAAAAFPTPVDLGFPESAIKAQSSDVSLLPAPIALIRAALLSTEMVAWLRVATRVADLFPDQQSHWGAIRIAADGAVLPPHIGSGKHPNGRWQRYVTLLLYLNRDWTTACGGAFELWDHNGVAPKASFLPIINRCIMFKTDERAVHGHAKVTIPPGQWRKLISAHYYRET